jgi:hypothetical protein
VQHRLALLGIQTVEKLIALGLDHVLHTQFAPLLLISSFCIVASGITRPTYRRWPTALRRNACKWHTHFVLNAQWRFFYGYRPTVPVV